jgi:DNA-binding transcriptional regulator YiaG
MSTPAPHFAKDEMRSLRKSVALSQETVAERMGYATPWQYKRWERGVALISLARADQFLAIITVERDRIERDEQAFAQKRKDAMRHLLAS